LDALSALFCLVITGVGTLIHIYSIGYMDHDETPGKFFAYLNLFCFAMLILVLGGSLPLTFLGWEGVGLCSYLLIGYWYTDDDKASAGKKAFIVNRVGDFGFLLGMFLIFTTFGSFDYLQINLALQSGSGLIGATTLSIIGLLLFLGCTGKSAQIPLYVWLPDAMAGPTPVSALIHAATMVTSGIYVISRLSFLFAQAPMASMVIAWVGVITAFFAATMALAQDDIKKVLAYSTVSQLGYMFLAVGVGAYSAGVFHVITHAFFKALMFLGAGSVIYGMHHEQDIQKMGGVRADMPKTFLVFAAGWVAICGFPFTSGFFSKDEILWSAFNSPTGSKGMWALGLVTAMMTAAYMTRLFYLTFLGSRRADESGKKIHAHETPNVMVYPLYVLAFLSIVGGAIGVPHASWIHHWLEGTVYTAEAHGDFTTEMMMMVVNGLVAFAVMFGTIKFFQNEKMVKELKGKTKGLYRLMANKWYVDEIYDKLIVQPLLQFSGFLWKVFDVLIIDRFVLMFGWVASRAGQNVRLIQTGTIQLYGLAMVLGMLITVGYLVYGSVWR